MVSSGESGLATSSAADTKPEALRTFLTASMTKSSLAHHSQAPTSSFCTATKLLGEVQSFVTHHPKLNKLHKGCASALTY